MHLAAHADEVTNTHFAFLQGLVGLLGELAITADVDVHRGLELLVGVLRTEMVHHQHAGEILLLVERHGSDVTAQLSAVAHFVLGLLGIHGQGILADDDLKVTILALEDTVQGYGVSRLLFGILVGLQVGGDALELLDELLVPGEQDSVMIGTGSHGLTVLLVVLQGHDLHVDGSTTLTSIVHADTIQETVKVLIVVVMFLLFHG